MIKLQLKLTCLRDLLAIKFPLNFFQKKIFNFKISENCSKFYAVLKVFLVLKNFDF